jgi:shikimate dehydrogenase
VSLTGKARIAGVMGWPVSHSRSPRLHGYWLEQYAIDGAYVPLPVRPEHLGAALAALPKLGFAGVNLTIPHKEAALTHLQQVEARARLIGAVNTIVVEADGSLSGSNTDVVGFEAALRAGAPALDTTRPAVLLGAGGAARAIIAALHSLGFSRVRLVNRTAAKAKVLAESFAPLGLGFETVDWNARARALSDAGLLVNATSLGMTGQPPLDLDLSALPRSAVVSDIVYVPLETPLLAAARARGLLTVDGLGMLLHQARPGFKAWFGVDPAVTPALRAHVLGGG